MEQLVGSLLQSDTASAFNISLQDVTVETTSRPVPPPLVNKWLTQLALAKLLSDPFMSSAFPPELIDKLFK